MLTKRLSEIISVLPKCRVLADVGCDHGYVGLAALQSNVCERVIFVDISAPSLQKARQNCPEGLKTRAEFVCQDGLGNIEVDCAVIAGMGGLEVISVLEGAQTLPLYVVLQPMRNQRDVRIWLTKGYKILSDQIFFDGKFYDLIVAKQNADGCILTSEELTFGKTNLQNPSPDFVAFLEKEQKKYQQILQQCNDTEVSQKYAEICGILDRIREATK